jgi:hypothetical protein
MLSAFRFSLLAGPSASALTFYARYGETSPCRRRYTFSHVPLFADFSTASVT